MSYSGIGPGLAANAIIEYVGGLGLYSISGWGAFLYDETAKVWNRFPLLFGGAFTGLAYDPETGRLTATAGTLLGGTGHASIYNIDPRSGMVTLLNSSAPNLYGIAAVNTTPEPGPMLLVAASLLCLSRRLGPRA